MFLETHIPPGEPASLSYLLGCAGQGKAIAVDVHADEVEYWRQVAADKGVRIAYVVDTHVHADHRSGGPALAEQTGASYVLHEQSQCYHPHESVQDGDRLKAGNVQVQVLHTPGHTLDSICLLVSDLSRVDEPWFVLTGHTLFVGSVGRPDLPGQAEKMAGHLYHSLHDKLLTLPDYVEILPGARAGSVCGVGLSGKPVSTLGFERRFNPVMQLDKAAFVRQALENLPPQPEGMAEIVRFNRGE